MEYHNFPIIKIHNPTTCLTIASAGPLPTPAPSVYAHQMLTLSKVTGDARQEHFSPVQAFSQPVFALHEMQRQHNGLYASCFVRIAECLQRLHRHELAGYAIAATRVQPQPAIATCVIAARSALPLGLLWVALHMLQQVCLDRIGVVLLHKPARVADGQVCTCCRCAMLMCATNAYVRY